MKNIKIISDGTNLGTKVVDVDTGKELNNVVKVMWELDAETGVAYATVTFFEPQIDAIGEKVETSTV